MLKRAIGLKKDEYFIDRKHVTKTEVPLPPTPYPSPGIEQLGDFRGLDKEDLATLDGTLGIGLGVGLGVGPRRCVT